MPFPLPKPSQNAESSDLYSSWFFFAFSSWSCLCFSCKVSPLAFFAAFGASSDAKLSCPEFFTADVAAVPVVALLEDNGLGPREREGTGGRMAASCRLGWAFLAGPEVQFKPERSFIVPGYSERYRTRSGTLHPYTISNGCQCSPIDFESLWWTCERKSPNNVYISRLDGKIADWSTAPNMAPFSPGTASYTASVSGLCSSSTGDNNTL